jgi:hypothetical protein
MGRLAATAGCLSLFSERRPNVKRSRSTSRDGFPDQTRGDVDPRCLGSAVGCAVIGVLEASEATTPIAEAEMTLTRVSDFVIELSNSDFVTDSPA